jgi:hypothetical protein
MPLPPIFDAEINRAPALRISNIVRGRENPDGRVRYLVDHEGRGGERGIPEEVVLLRWRRRVMPGYTFHGGRLGPNLWRAVHRAFGADAQAVCKLSLSQISSGRERLQQGRRTHHLWLPDASLLNDLFTFLRPDRLQSIFDRHLHPDRADRFGTPDLFLFARENVHGRPAFFRLVEVKKPGERISLDQHEEITFLRSIGVPVRVLRLIER